MSIWAKAEIALAQIETICADGGRFSCVLADAKYGSSVPFWVALSERGLTWAADTRGATNIYPRNVAMVFPVPGSGRPRQRYLPDQPLVAAEIILTDLVGRVVT